MGLPNVFQTGVTGMNTSRAAVATTGHNIANANTEGYSRQRVLMEAQQAKASGPHTMIGQGAKIQRVERVNDEYIEKQIRNSNREMAHMEEKDVLLRQTEDIFNEMNGDGLNRLVAKFFNDFRKLANEPENEAVRQSVRESSQAMVNDFHRLRNEVEDVRRHVDARLEGYTTEINSLSDEIKGLNLKIRQIETGGGVPNDLLDKRDLAIKRLASYMDMANHKDNHGNVIIDVTSVGPLVVAGDRETYGVIRTPADDQGKPENAFDVKTSGSAQAVVTHQVKGGKLGALLEVRDQTLSTILKRLDDLAYGVSQAVNSVHAQGYTRGGERGVAFFRNLGQKERAAEFIGLSDAVRSDVSNIAAAMLPDAPGDNRVAIGIANLQDAKIMSGGQSTFDEWYNSIVSDVGVAAARNRNGMNQQKDIITQLNKMHDQISGVSIDEETANLLQFQHTYSASAKVIQVADDMLKTVLELKR